MFFGVFLVIDYPDIALDFLYPKSTYHNFWNASPKQLSDHPKLSNNVPKNEHKWITNLSYQQIPTQQPKILLDYSRILSNLFNSNIIFKNIPSMTK